MVQPLDCVHGANLVPASSAAGILLAPAGATAADTNDGDENPFAKMGGSKKNDGQGGGDDKKKPGEKKGKGLYIGLGVGAFVLLSCCCCGGGGGGWWVYNTYFAKPPFYGAWVQKDEPFHILGFDPGGRGYYVNVGDMLKEGKKEPSKEPNCKWTMTDAKTVEIVMNDSSKKLWVDSNKATFTFAVATNELTLTNKADNKSTIFIKVDEKKK